MKKIIMTLFIVLTLSACSVGVGVGGGSNGVGVGVGVGPGVRIYKKCPIIFLIGHFLMFNVRL